MENNEYSICTLLVHVHVYMQVFKLIKCTYLRLNKYALLIVNNIDDLDIAYSKDFHFFAYEI